MKTLEQLVITNEIYLEETCWEEVDWTNLVQDTEKQRAFVAATMNIRVQ
jgi:hypothetical protein